MQPSPRANLDVPSAFQRMRSLAIAAVAAFATVASANKGFTATEAANPWVHWTNGTHFKDMGTNQTIKHFDCDVHQGKASAHFNSTIRLLHANNRHQYIGSGTAGHMSKRAISPAIVVPTYIHILTKQASAGSITQTMANAQITALNKAYNPYGVKFTLAGTTFTANDAWAVAAGSDMNALKQNLRQGTYSSLNLYFHTDLSGGVLGTCTLPSQVSPGTPVSAYYTDGCNIAAATMPGASMQGYNQGKTAVHETGHWLGLLHTFEGYACSGNGDFIADTNFESASTDGCPTSPAKSTCGTKGGDPIHNYMDYSTDACYSRFTLGQVARISSMWNRYRKGN